VLAVLAIQERRENPEEAFVRHLQAGDEEAFAELMRRYKDRVYNVLYRYVGNHEDALDLAQEVFIRAFRGAAGFRGHASVYTWLYSIAENLGRNRLRDRRRKGRDKGRSLEALEAEQPGRVSGLMNTENHPRTAAEAAELRHALEACLQKLPEPFRFTFVLRTFDGLGYDEIAEATNCPKGTVKSRLNQARQRLHGCLQREGVL
jgi:RNA polymerase sigma-70 factor (ECF subfamily)